MARAIDRLKAKIKPDTVVMLFFGGYGVQVGRESFMIPVDAAIWKEADVRRDGVSDRAGAGRDDREGRQGQARRASTPPAATPMSAASAPIPTAWPRSRAPENALILTSATPGKVADDGKGQYSVLVAELLNNLNAQAGAASRLQQDPRLRLPRLRRRAGAARCRRRCWKTSASAGETRHRDRARLNHVVRARRRDDKREAYRRYALRYFASRSPSPPAPDRLRAAARRRAPPRCRLRPALEVISTWPADISPVSTRRVSTRARRTTCTTVPAEP